MKVLLAVCVIFVASVFAEKECEQRRLRLQEHPLLGALVPNCDKNGDFLPLQCHHDRFCQCWDKSGTPLTKPSKTIKACDCVLERHEGLHSQNELEMMGVFIPTCTTEGHYDSLQCWSSTGTCWCADKQGNKLSEPTRERLNC